ncbi:MAG TPA: hypothetical protein VKE40_10135, partial [Gemmataceae bacterium]|nr:hypothetical protein [Gemmataceae bacterium]
PPPVVEAVGIVRLDGKPLKNVMVRFVPVNDFGSDYQASGVTDASGRFTLSCNGQPGACACENRVTVSEADIPAHLKGEDLKVQAELARYLEGLGGRPLPPKYSNLAESPLTVTVTAEQREYVLELVR